MKISQTVFSLLSGHEYKVEKTIFNVLRAIIQNVDNSELLFMCSAHCLLVLYICVKFRENITNGIRVMERTRVHGRNGYIQCSKGNNSVKRQTRVTVYLFCKLSHSVLHWGEVS